MRGVLLGLIAAVVVSLASAPAMAHGPRYGVRVYGGYPAYYGVYRPYYYGPAYYPPPPPRVYYPAPYPVYPAPAFSGYYGGPSFSFSFGR